MQRGVCSPATGTDVSLTTDRFEKLLSLLAADRETAGDQYELIRLKLVKFFEVRMCPEPDDLADETIDRVARRVGDGETIRSPDLMPYVYGVARNVLLEVWKRERRVPATGDLMAAQTHTHFSVDELTSEWRFDCFQECLNELSEDSRGLLIRYYARTGHKKIEARAELAASLGVPVNALRIRIHRVKARLQKCMDKCMKRVRTFATTGGG